MKTGEKNYSYLPVFPTPPVPRTRIRNGFGFVCRPILARDDFGDVEFIMTIFFSLPRCSNPLTHTLFLYSIDWTLDNNNK